MPRSRLSLVAAVVSLSVISPAHADGPSMIRDAEVEDTLRLLSTPIFQAGGLDPNAVSLNIILDPSLNAFVSGGQDMYFHTGLLTKVDSANQLIGVMAHETGHIVGGHLANMDNAIATSSTAMILGMAAGLAAGIAARSPEAGMALMDAGQNIALRNILAFSRGQEAAADQAGLRFLNSTQQSPNGLMEFMETLGGQELLVTTKQDPYVRTHPLTRDRIATFREAAQHSPWQNTPTRPEYQEPFLRMKAKLFAYLEPPSRTLQRYKESDTSIASRYARAIAAYRKPDLGTALPLMDGLIAERPKDPFFYEMKGQMLFENARGGEAIPLYRKATDLKPDNALMRVELAQVEIEQDDPNLLGDAITQLNKALQMDSSNAEGWNQLGLAYGKQENEGMASYAMAECALLQGRATDAAYLANRAERMLPKTGPIWLRLQDIKERAETARMQRRR